MKTHRLIHSSLLVGISILLIGCSLLSSGEKIEELEGTIQAMSTQIGVTLGDEPGEPTEAVVKSGDGDEFAETPLAPQGNDGLELVGQYGGSAAAVAVRGNYAFLGQGPRLVVLDVANPSNPQFITQSDVLPGIVLGIDVDDRYVYVTTRYGGINIFDYQQPDQLTRLGSAEPDNPGCGSIELVGKTAYIACNPGGLFIVDVTNPADPNIMSDGVVSGSYISIAVVGDHAYLADINGGGLTIALVSDPANPRQIGTFDVNQIPGDYTRMIAAVQGCGEILCLAVQNYGLALLNLADPARPVFLAGDSPYFTSGIVIQGDYAYLLADAEPGLMIYDISKPLQPLRVGLLPTSVGGLEFAVNELPERGMYAAADGRLYIPDQKNGLTIVDVRDFANPRLLGSYMTPVPDWLTDIRVSEGFAYVVSRFGGFRVVDVSEETDPREVFYDDERKNLYLQVPTALELVGSYALIADANYPLHAYDIKDHTKAAQVSALFDEAASDGAHDMVIKDNYAYLSGWGGKDAFYPGKGIWVVDISRPDELEVVNFVDLPNGRWSLAFNGSTLYALDGEMDPDQAEPFSLRILDIGNGAKPIVVKSIPIPELQMMSPSGLLVTGKDLYLSTGMNGMKRYDITNPRDPVELAIDNSFFTYAFQLYAENPFLVVNGNQLLDITQPDAPEFIGYATEALEAWASDIEGDLLFIATRLHGIYVYRINGQ